MERAADTTGVKATDTELGRLGQAVRGNPIGLSLFLLVGLVLVGATLLVSRWVADVDPGNAKAPVPAGIVALEFAGEKNAASEIIQGWRSGPDDTAPANKARDSLERDLVFILLYVATLGYWCTYSSWLSHRPKVRRLARRLAVAAVVAGLLDCVENIFLRRMVDGVEVSGSDARWATAASITKWVLVLMAGLCATGAVLSALNRWFARVIVGPASRPTFVGDIHAVPLPAPPIPDGDAYEQKKWERRGQTPDGSAWGAGRTGPAVGIALSGGGIRAASFALGALQGLQDVPFDKNAPAGPSVYARADFLSTVSGGGYTGTATQIINHQIGKGDPPPFGMEAKEAEYVRDHCRFLWGPPLKGRRAQSTRDFIGSALLALLGIAFNVLLVLGLLFVLARPFGWFIRSTLFVGLPPRPGVPRRHMSAGLWWGAAGSTIALLVILVPYFWRQRTTVSRVRQSVPIIATIVVAVGVALYTVRVGFPSKWLLLVVPFAFAVLGFVLQRTGFQKGAVLAVTISWFLVGAAATLFGRWVHAAFRTASNGDVTSAPVFIIAAIFLFLILFVVVAAVMRVLLEPRRKTANPTLLVVGGGVAAVIIAGILTWVIAALCHDAYHVRLGSDRGVWLVVALVMLAIYLFADQKRWSPHLMYKRRLATAFALSRDDADNVDELPYRIGTTLSAWAAKVPDAPKLLVCGAVYDRVNVRRDSDGNKSDDDIPAWPFVFSSDYVGNADLGWMRTVDFEAALGRANRPDGTLLAAMAISGAAVSPAIGAVKLGALNSLIATLNLRLGVWLPNPRYVGQLRDKTFNAPTWVRIRRFTYLLKDIVGAYSPDDRFVYVTDGGQFDNLAVYELLSRRCAEIFCVDASGDNAPGKELNTNTFDGLRMLARQRLGVLFSIPGEAPDGDTPLREGGTDVERSPGVLTAELCTEDTTDLPQSWTGNKPPMAVSKNLVVTLDIHYPNGDRGKLHYMKALLTSDAPGEVIRQATSPTGKRFPSDTTVDQWLDADQFEAYVELGRFAAKRAVAERAQHA
jgi:hypothetical protein